MVSHCESRGAPTGSAAHTNPDGIRVTRARDIGTVVARRTRLDASRTLTGNVVYPLKSDTALMVFDHYGALIIEHPWPAPGTK